MENLDLSKTFDISILPSLAMHIIAVESNSNHISTNDKQMRAKRQSDIQIQSNRTHFLS